MTYEENIMGQIPCVWQGWGPMQAPAECDGKVQRVTHLGGQRVVPEQRAWRSREGKGIPPAWVRF